MSLRGFGRILYCFHPKANLFLISAELKGIHRRVAALQWRCMLVMLEMLLPLCVAQFHQVCRELELLQSAACSSCIAHSYVSMPDLLICAQLEQHSIPHQKLDTRR